MFKHRIILIVSFAIFLAGCSKEDHTSREPKNPLLTTSLMKQYAIEDNYKQFKTLMLDGYDEESIAEIYETVRRTATNSADIKSFTLVTFDNGKTLLVHLTPLASEDGEVLIQDVIEIPTEMAKYIEEELNKRFEK